MSEAFCPEEFWNYNYCNSIDINDKTLAGVKIKGKLVEELNNLYSTYLNKSAVHPSLLKIAQQLDEEEEIEKEKERLKKEQEKSKNQKKPGEVEDTKRTLMNVNKEEDGGGETNEEEEVQEKVLKEIIFNSIRIDQNTIKFLFLMLPRTPIVSLKTSYNNLTLKNFNLLIDSLIHKPNNI